MRVFGRILLALTLVGHAAVALAGSPARLGTGGALELLIPTDARGVAMGGSVMAENQGSQAWFWNPAGAADVAGSEVTLSHRQYIADIGLSHFALARNVGDMGVIGISAKVLSSDDEPVYTTQQPNGTGETFAASFVVVGISYARALTDRVAFGMNGHYIAEEIFRETAQGVAFDLGFTYRPSWEGLTLGVAIKNYGPKMAFDGPDFEVPGGNEDGSGSGGGARSVSASFELPSFMQFGFSWDALQHNRNQVKLAGVFQANNFSDDEYRLGGEWGISEQFFLRGGYAASSQAAYPFGFSAGGGLALPMGETLTRIDYAWVDAGVFGNNHLFTVSLAF